MASRTVQIELCHIELARTVDMHQKQTRLLVAGLMLSNEFLPRASHFLRPTPTLKESRSLLRASIFSIFSLFLDTVIFIFAQSESEISLLHIVQSQG